MKSDLLYLPYWCDNEIDDNWEQDLYKVKTGKRNLALVDYQRDGSGKAFKEYYQNREYSENYRTGLDYINTPDGSRLYFLPKNRKYAKLFMSIDDYEYEVERSVLLGYTIQEIVGYISLQNAFQDIDDYIDIRTDDYIKDKKIRSTMQLLYLKNVRDQQYIIKQRIEKTKKWISEYI